MTRASTQLIYRRAIQQTHFSCITNPLGGFLKPGSSYESTLSRIHPFQKPNYILNLRQDGGYSQSSSLSLSNPVFTSNWTLKNVCVKGMYIELNSSMSCFQDWPSNLPYAGYVRRAQSSAAHDLKSNPRFRPVGHWKKKKEPQDVHIGQTLPKSNFLQ